MTLYDQQQAVAELKQRVPPGTLVYTLLVDLWQEEFAGGEATKRVFVPFVIRNDTYYSLVGLLRKAKFYQLSESKRRITGILTTEDAYELVQSLSNKLYATCDALGVLPLTS